MGLFMSGGSNNRLEHSGKETIRGKYRFWLPVWNGVWAWQPGLECALVFLLCPSFRPWPGVAFLGVRGIPLVTVRDMRAATEAR